MKKALWAAGLLLVAGTATACGDAGEAPGGAPRSFCEQPPSR